MKTCIYDYRHEDAVLIRQEVFMKEQGISYEYDEMDEISAHIVIYDGEPIGVCRIFPDENNDSEYIVGRLAVMKSHRNRGIGRKLLEACEEFAKSKSGRCVKLHSQYHALEFYEKCGYIAKGEIEEEAGIPHVWMYKELK